MRVWILGSKYTPFIRRVTTHFPCCFVLPAQKIQRRANGEFIVFDVCDKREHVLDRVIELLCCFIHFVRRHSRLCTTLVVIRTENATLKIHARQHSTGTYNEGTLQFFGINPFKKGARSAGPHSTTIPLVVTSDEFVNTLVVDMYTAASDAPRDTH